MAAGGGLNIVLLLIPLGMVLVVAAAAALIWAVDSGQYDGDVEGMGLIAVEPDAAIRGSGPDGSIADNVH